MPQPSAGSVRVLLVDDEPAFRGRIGGFLEDEPAISVVEAADPEAAAEVDGSSDIDAVVCSAGSIEADPEAAVANLHEVADDPRIVLLAGEEPTATVDAAVRAGVDDCFPRAAARAQYGLLAERLREWAEPGAGTAPRDPALPAREVFENVSDGLVIHDPETGEILDVNHRFCEMNGYDRGELVGEDIAVVTANGEAAVEAAAERIERARTSGPQLFEWENERRDGETFPVEVHLAVVTLGGRERVLASVRDVTERSRRERTIRNLHDATERIQEATTPDRIAEIAIETARDVLGLPTAACWFHREADGREWLEPVAGAVPSGAFEPDSFEPGDVEYEAFDAGETLVYDPSDHSPSYTLEAAIMLPLGDHGLLGVGRRGVVEHEPFMLDAGRTLAGHVRTALDRATRARELRESERRFRLIAERIDQVVYLANADLTELMYVNPAYEAVFGRSTDELYADPRSFLDAVHPEDEPAYRREFEAMLADIEAGDPADAYRFEFRIRRPDGERRFVDATGYPVLDEAGEPYRFVGLVEDVTAEKERERRLETFHGTTRMLTRATSRADAGRIAADAAEDVLSLPYVSVHLHDEAEGHLEPVAATGALARDLDGVPAFPPGENLPWQVFVDGEPVRRSTDDGSIDGFGEDVPGPDLLLPLGPHGVMLVGAADASLSPERVELAQILAATLEAALNHVRGERELERREAELRRQRDRAARLDRLNSVIRDIEQATVEEPTREAVEATVCARLTDVEPYRAAWIAGAEPGADALSVRASAGEDAGYLARLDLDLDRNDDASLDPHPAVEAHVDGTVAVRRGLAGAAPHGDWQTEALRRGHQSVIAVPLDQDGIRHGVLAVAADSPNAFDEEERAVLSELGRSIGHELGVLERRRALESDTTTELEFNATDPDLPFVRLSARGDCRVDLERSIRRADGRFSVFYAVEGITPEEAVEVARGIDGLCDTTILGRDGAAGLVEVRLESWFGSRIADHGGLVRTATATDGEGRLGVELPSRADVRGVVESFRHRYAGVELVAKRDRERAVRTAIERAALLEDRLTPRQLETLEMAYAAGYFEWPRTSTGEDVASLLGITQPTFNKHLRAAERKTFGLLLDPDADAPA